MVYFQVYWVNKEEADLDAHNEVSLCKFSKTREFIIITTHSYTMESQKERWRQILNARTIQKRQNNI